MRGPIGVMFYEQLQNLNPHDFEASFYKNKHVNFVLW